jgi:hypothetical protein
MCSLELDMNRQPACRGRSGPGLTAGLRGYTREHRVRAGGLAQEDKAAKGFLKLLVVLRSVLLQDLAVLQPGKCLIY